MDTRLHPRAVRMPGRSCRSTCVRTPLAALTAAWTLNASIAHAGGTPPGTNITNQASITYTVGGAQLVQNSNPSTIIVEELINLNLVWQDASNVIVGPGDTGRLLTFLLTNTGNGNESFGLTTDSNVSGDDFNPTFSDLYLDANGNGVYDAGVDAQYAAGINDPVLGADSSTAIFVLHDIPAGLVDADIGNCDLTAASNTGTGAPGSSIPGAGDGGANAVIGNSGGSATNTGGYVVTTVVVTMLKSATVLDPFGGSDAVPGAVLTYTITVDVTGSGTAQGVVITDPFPVNTTYVASSLTLNSGALTDAVDADAGDVNATTAGSITIALGNLTDASPLQTITFNVTID